MIKFVESEITLRCVIVTYVTREREREGQILFDLILESNRIWIFRECSIHYFRVIENFCEILDEFFRFKVDQNPPSVSGN